MSRRKRMLSLLAIDAILISGSIYLAYLLRFDFHIPDQFTRTFGYVIVTYLLLTILAMHVFKIYRRVWQYASIGDLISIFKGAVFGSVAMYLLHQLVVKQLFTGVVIPRSIYPISLMLIFLTVGGSRFIWRMLRDNYIKIQPHHKRALIIGAGDAGTMIVKELKHTDSEYYPVAFIDDNENKQDLEVLGVPVVGGREQIPAAVKKHNIQLIILALPSASRKEIADILKICKQTGCQIKMIPRMQDLIDGKVSLSTIRDVSVEDLLGREPVSVNLEEIAGYLSGQVVLVTGAGGSIGSELCRQVAAFQPKLLILLGHGENSIYEVELELRNRYPSLPLEPVIADIQNRNRIEAIFAKYKPQVVFHAAAHKHVPMMEKNPLEAIKNNVFGTKNVAECAHKYNAQRFVMISTDKAVNPTNVMGTTKRIAEMIVQSIDKQSKTVFTSVRFGNVLGSRGSVIPIFKKQIQEGGPVTVTHPDMIRYFMTIPEAVQLVIQAGALASGGEVFVLDMGEPVKIADLAHDLIRLSGLEPGVDIQIVYTGIRPGEKLFEEILTQEEGTTATKHDRIYVGRPEQMDYDELESLLQPLERYIKEENLEDGWEEGLRLHLKRLVPTYQYKNSQEANHHQIEQAFRASREIVAALDGK